MAEMAFWKVAAEDPDHLALVDPDGVEQTAGQLLGRCNQVSRGLAAMGLGRGDAVAMVMSNEAAAFELALATMQSGLYLVPVNWHLVTDEIAYVIRDSGSKALVCSPALAASAGAAADAAGLPADARFCTGDVEGFRAFSSLGADASTDPPAERWAGGTMNYTSGTTGFPKGVRRPLPPAPPEMIADAYASFLMLFGVTPGTGGVHLMVAPVYHTAVLYFALNNLHQGHTVVMMDKWTPEGTLQRIERYGVTNSHMVPTHMNRMLNLPEAVRARYDVSSLRQVVHGAAPCPESVKRAALDWWGPCIFEYYAATEGGGTIASPQEWLARPGTVGKPWRGAEIRVYLDDGTPCAPGEVGTVYIKMAQGGFEYHKDKKKTGDAFRPDGFFTVGDAGYLDADGYLYLCDRKADMIISGGVNIYPAEIEAALISHPAVLDVAVFGIPNPDWGEQVHAIIELSSPAAPSDALAAQIIAYSRERLGGYKVPRSIDFIAEMPRDPNGKLAKRKLRDPYWADTGRAI